MANRLIKSARTTYVSAVQEVIARAAYCATTTRRIPTTTYVQRPSPQEVQRLINAGYNGVSISYVPVTTYRNVTSTECFPAVAGVEGRDAATNIDNLQGWNAGARSQKVLTGDAYVTFDIPPSAVGVAAGFAHPGSPVSSLTSITHGLLFTGGTVRVVERGVEVANSNITLTGSTPLFIRRAGGVVTYRVGGWEYESTAASLSSVGLTTCLYLAGDSVDNPQLGGIQLLESEGDWGWEDWQTSSALRARSIWGWGGSASVNEGSARSVINLSMAGSDYAYSTAALTLDGFSVRGEGGFPIVDSSGISTGLPMSMYGLGVSIDSGGVSMDMDIPAMVGSDYDYGRANLVLDGLSLYGMSTGEATDSGNASDLMMVADVFVSDPVLLGILTDSLALGYSLDVLLAMDASLDDYLILMDSMSATQVLEAMLREKLVFSDVPSAIQAAASQYATNLVTGAVGRYQGYDFHGFVGVGMDSFGWKPGGLYKLGQPIEEAEALSAFIEFAAEDFGTALRKRIDTVFIGVATNGEMLLRMTPDDGPELVYCARAYGPTARAYMSKGVTSRFWRMKLEVSNATQVELDNVEWLVMPTTRRTTR